MHIRRYTALDLVGLPRLDARSAVAIGHQIIAAAKPHKKGLPEGVGKALAEVVAAHAALQDVLRDRTAVPPGQGQRRAIDRTVDGAWSGLYDLLGAYDRLVDHPASEEAKEVRAMVFPDGLRFTQLPFVLQWTEGDLRLQRIEQYGLEPRIVALGGHVFLEVMKRSHREYGQILGMKAPIAAVDEADLRGPLDAFLEKLRVYVLRAAASGDAERPGSEELVEKLLLPLHTWALGSSRPKPGEEEETPVAAPDLTPSSPGADPGGANAGMSSSGGVSAGAAPPAGAVVTGPPEAAQGPPQAQPSPAASKPSAAHPT